MKLKKIWALAKSLGLSDDHLYLTCASITGLESLSTLVKKHPEKTSQLIKHLEHMLYKQNRKDYRTSKKPGVFKFPTRSQKDLVVHLVTEINSTGQKISAEDIAQRTYKKTYQMLNYHQIQGLIEALKSIRSRLHLP